MPWASATGMPHGSHTTLEALEEDGAVAICWMAPDRVTVRGTGVHDAFWDRVLPLIAARAGLEAGRAVVQGNVLVHGGKSLLVVAPHARRAVALATALNVVGVDVQWTGHVALDGLRAYGVPGLGAGARSATPPEPADIDTVVLLQDRETGPAAIEPASSKTTQEWLAAFASTLHGELRDQLIAWGGPEAFLAGRRAETTVFAELAGGAPTYRADGDDVQVADALIRAIDGGSAWTGEPERLSDEHLRMISEIQDIAGRVYGRLEPERAVAWALEELGELAQALRRGEGMGRVREELGQLFAWTLCLANIAGADLGVAAELAVRREVQRQVAAYGRLRPYDPAVPRAG